MPPGSAKSQGRPAVPPILWAAAACLACLVPFLNKAFHIDDTLFLKAAQHIQQENAFDFFGASVNWYGNTMPMSEVMQNPPLASYYLALVASVLGWSEPALHLAFLLPAVLAICGTYRLAEQLSARPLLAALATLLTPAFLVSSTNVMCDTLTLCFWVWAVVWWDHGLRQRQLAWLFLSTVLICLTCLTKYIGMGLIPLLLVYTLVRQRGQGLAALLTPCLPLAIPLLVLSLYQVLTEDMYGRGLLFQAIGYAAYVRGSGQALTSAFFSESVGCLCFLGGSVATLLFFAPLLWSKWQLLVGLALSAVLFLGLALAFFWAGELAERFPDMKLDKSFPFGTPPGTVPWFGLLQFAAYAAAGFSLFALVISDLKTRRDSGSLLLALWVGGIFVFATFLNWTLNVRSLLPLVPAAAILIARRLDLFFSPATPARRVLWPLIPAGMLALAVTWADYQMADSVRAAAAEIIQTCADQPGRTWFQGHWGFQYYMQKAGIAPLEVDLLEVAPGDLIIYPDPYTNSNIELQKPPLPRRPVRQLEVASCRWLATMDISVGAGFYAGIWGALPFAFGPTQPARYTVVEVTRP
jgi:4-amino-4-deoxy-L-arabinose transferase-like glycosyltransferase